MASILRSIFTSKASGTPNSRIKGHSYDSAIALDPPVKGSYPVAGNGPHVLQEIQRSRAQRETSNAQRQSSAAVAPNVPRFRADNLERPKTAPNDGTVRSGHNKRSSTSSSGSWAGRTRSGFSGFSTKSSPSILRSKSRRDTRNSIRSTTEHPVPPVFTPSSAPKAQTYQPTNLKGTGPSSASQHMRNTSTSSHRSYVDLLEAHSSIRPGTSKNRTKVSGVRNYGEDVADRNIDRFGTTGHPNPSQLDLNSPQFGYIKKRPMGHVAGHGRGDDGPPSDDTPPRSNGKSSSPRSSTTSTTRTHPLRAKTDFSVLPCTTTTPSHDHQITALSSLSQSNNAQSIDEHPIMRDTLRKLIRPNQPSSQPRETEYVARDPPPVAVTISRPMELPREDNTASSNSTVNQTVKRMPALPASNESAAPPPVNVKSNTNGHKKSKSGSVSYSTFPNITNRPGNISQMDRVDFAVRPPSASKTNKRQGTIIENSAVPPNLDGVADLSKTVDTDVTTRTLSAVVHDHVTPVQNEVREERIIREIHTHEVRHHILPVINTEILPPKHYIRSPDGKGLIEIPEPQVPEYKLTGRMNGNWSLSKTPMPSRSRTSSQVQPPAYHRPVPDEYESAEAPVIGLVRGDPKPRSRSNSRASNHAVKQYKSSKKISSEPVLASKKEYMTEEGYPRTEYVWRHPPVFQDAVGRTQPVTMGADFGGSRATPQQFLEEGLHQNEESLLFQDSGYGFQGMLPGLSSLAPTVGSRYKNDGAVVCDLGEQISLGRVVDNGKMGKVKIASHSEGEATKALKRMQERRRSSAASGPAGTNGRRASTPHVGDVVQGVEGLHV